MSFARHVSAVFHVSIAVEPAGVSTASTAVRGRAEEVPRVQSG